MIVLVVLRQLLLLMYCGVIWEAEAVVYLMRFNRDSMNTFAEQFKARANAD